MHFNEWNDDSKLFRQTNMTNKSPHTCEADCQLQSETQTKLQIDIIIQQIDNAHNAQHTQWAKENAQIRSKYNSQKSVEINVIVGKNRANSYFFLLSSWFTISCRGLFDCLVHLQWNTRNKM